MKPSPEQGGGWLDTIKGSRIEGSPANQEFMRKCDEITDAIRHLHDCKEALTELYEQAGKRPDGVEPYLWSRVAGLVGGE